MTVTAPSGGPAGRRVRTRLVLTVVGLVTLASVALSSLAYVLVARSLQAEVLDRALEEARFNVEVLAAERLDEEVRPGDIEASGLADDFQRRGVAVYVDLGAGPGDDFVSGLDVVNVPAVVSTELRRSVGEGRVAAEWLDLEGTPRLVVAARRPPAGPDFYFVTDVSDMQRALAQLRLVLVGASLVLILLGTLAGRRGARLAGSLADSVAELTAARERERRFVADVSHELRTPVTALVQEADELAARVEELPADTRRVVELLDGDVHRLRDLVEELLELSRLDTTDVTAETEVDELDVGRFLGAIVARRAPQAAVEVPTGLRVRTDRRRLERVVANLVDNAHEHAAGVGVTITAHTDDATLVIEVADRGPGVPGDQLERIFDRFSKADTARGRGGSGLGLAIVRAHARVLGATVTARNRDGGGLAVTVRLPVEVVAEP
ncbi:MAG: sensor histidine kinase [Nitriliruptor sp.]|nr:MAG: sensor histidine kinase [Nitriliruptor sp.]